MRVPAIAVVLALSAIGATACESRVTGQVLFAGDFTATDSSPWVSEYINTGATGLLPTVNAIDAAGVRDASYWEARFAALRAANGGYDAVVLSLGSNDVQDGDLTTDVADRIAEIADAAGGEQQKAVFWATLSEVSPAHHDGAVAFNEALRSVATSRPNLQVLEFGAAIGAHPEYLAADGVHWSQAGQKAFATLVADSLVNVPLAASFTVAKTADDTTVTAGDAVDYRITVTNTGSVTLHHVVVADAAAPGCAGTLPDLAAGEAHTEDCTYTTTSADIGTHQNTATVSTDEARPVVSNRVDVIVQAPSGVSGSVTDGTSGVPVSGAWVAVLRASDLSLVGGGVADGAGAFSVAAPAGSYFVYVIDATGGHRAGFFGAPTAVTVTSGNVVDVDPQMAPLRGSIHATVTETGSGAPIPGVWGLALSSSAANPGATEVAVVADGSGRLTLPDLGAGDHYVGFVDPAGGHQTRFWPDSLTVPAATPVAVAAGATTEANASLPAQTLVGTGSVISGTVTEAGTNTPLANARVFALRAADYRIVRAATTNAAGQYRLDLAAGAYKLAFLDADGGHHLEWFDDLPNTGLASAVSVIAPGTADAALDATTATMAGTVTDDPSGAPVAGAWVVAIGPTGIAGGAVTATDGTYTIAGLAPGTYRATFVDPNGGRTQEYHDNSPDYPGAAPINLTPAHTTTINAALALPAPNIVMILTDDQTLESMRVMPRVQALLADEGTTFANAFDTFPLCCPARATVLTGQYAHNHHVVNNVAMTSAPNDPIGGSGALDHTNTLATWLHAGGYQTAHVGKFLNCWGNNTSSCRAGAPTVPPGWDDWFGLIDPYPAAYGYFEFDVLDNAQVRHIGPAADIYQTDVLADRAVADVQRMSASGRPFFLNLWPQAPHAGVGSTAPNGFSPAPAPRHTALFTTEPAPATPAVGEADVSDKPSYIRCGIGLTPGEPPAPGCTSAPTSTWTASGIAATYRATLQSLQAVDEMVGRVVQALDDTGELDNTVIVFTSDNGLQNGEHRLNFRKVVPYEESVHVPLIIRGPGFPAGRVARQIVGNIDIAPTITGLAGVTAGRVMDGRSLVALAQNPSIAADRALLLEDWPVGAFVGIPPHYDGIRTATDVYLEYSTGEREYYDLSTDPYQLTSRHADPSTASRRSALATVLAQLKTCVGASCEVAAPP